ncbi:MAG TPA: S24 family peptidase [Pseudobacteroides sp.]|uniref:LexA family protein n=1 Tax=Pseudobacteroides sp. TaxID=1968840 RepID=UPI002F930A8D
MSVPSEFDSLTSKQKKIYSAIETFIRENGIPPTVREIGELVGEKTPGAVQGILNRLQQKGVIKREVGMARSIKLVSGNSQYTDPVYIPEVKKISKRNIGDLYSIYNVVKYQPVPPDFLEDATDCFILNCPDNSLIDSGIKYEDVLVISKGSSICDGDIVLILFENSALLRKYYKGENEDSITLKADSNLLGRETFSKDEVIIVGRLVGKYTKY